MLQRSQRAQPREAPTRTSVTKTSTDSSSNEFDTFHNISSYIHSIQYECNCFTIMVTNKVLHSTLLLIATSSGTFIIENDTYLSLYSIRRKCQPRFSNRSSVMNHPLFIHVIRITLVYIRSWTVGWNLFCAFQTTDTLKIYSLVCDSSYTADFLLLLIWILRECIFVPHNFWIRRKSCRERTLLTVEIESTTDAHWN